MSTRTIESVVDIQEDRKLIVQLPLDVPLGRRRVVTMLEETLESDFPDNANAGQWAFPVLGYAQWPADLPMTRQEIYDDNGR